MLSTVIFNVNCRILCHYGRNVQKLKIPVLDYHISIVNKVFHLRNEFNSYLIYKCVNWFGTVYAL